MPELITTAEAAAALNVTERRVRQLAQELEPEPKRLGRQYVFTPAQIRAMEKRKTQRGPERGAKR